MDKRIVITIGRQLGSGGREIGKRLAEQFQIPFFDKELIVLAAKESGLCTEFFEKADEKATDSFSYAFTMGFPFLGSVSPYQDFLSNDTLFQIQSDTIRSLASQGSCVMVGRCADYILREDTACLNLFIHSSIENRVKRIVKSHNLSEDDAAEYIAKTDKKRETFYNYYSNKAWGVASTYHLSIDSDLLGVDKTVDMIACFIKEKTQTNI